MTGYNIISLSASDIMSPSIVLADFPGCLSWRSLGGLIAIDPVNSTLTDMAMKTNTGGDSTFANISTGPSRFLVMTTLLPYLIKLEYSVNKTYWHAGEFNVLGNLLGYSQVYMGHLTIYDEANDVRALINCTNTTWLEINRIINCSVDVLQPYPFQLVFLNDSARSNTTIQPNIMTSDVGCSLIIIYFVSIFFIKFKFYL